LLILTLAPATFIGLKIIPNVAVMPTPSNTDKIVDGAVTLAARNELESTPKKVAQASVITQQRLTKQS
jgi:hypothetical protein